MLLIIYRHVYITTACYTLREFILLYTGRNIVLVIVIQFILLQRVKTAMEACSVAFHVTKYIAILYFMAHWSGNAN